MDLSDFKLALDILAQSQHSGHIDHRAEQGDHFSRKELDVLREKCNRSAQGPIFNSVLQAF